MNGLDTKPRMPMDGPRAWNRGAQRARPAGASPAPGGARPRDRLHAGDHAESARDIRLRARGFVDATLRDARLGRTVDARGARALVEDLVTTVTDDPGAALRPAGPGERGEYTAIHCVNVCALALAFGIHLGLERHELIPLGMGALLHDIGKARTPGEILQKAGGLTPKEVAIVQRHSEDGHAIMAASPRMPRGALEVIRLHHERLGGQGYPFGLSGDQIPRHVRIAAIADVYDTLTSDRPYHRAGAPEEALRELSRDADANLGAGLVQAFGRCLDALPAGSTVPPGSRPAGAAAAGHDRRGIVAVRRIRGAVTRVITGVSLPQYAG